MLVLLVPLPQMRLQYNLLILQLFSRKLTERRIEAWIRKLWRRKDLRGLLKFALPGGIVRQLGQIGVPTQSQHTRCHWHIAQLSLGDGIAIQVVRLHDHLPVFLGHENNVLDFATSFRPILRETEMIQAINDKFYFLLPLCFCIPSVRCHVRRRSQPSLEDH